jgi:hypothetical protein
MDGFSGIESLEVEFFSFLANRSRIQLNEPLRFSLKLLSSGFGVKVQMSERVFGFFQIFFGVQVVLGLVEEKSVPGVTSPPSIHIEKFQRVVTRSRCKSCSRAHIRIIVFELVVLPDFLVD